MAHGRGEAAVAVADQDRDVVGERVRRDGVEVAVAVEIAQGERRRFVSVATTSGAPSPSRSPRATSLATA
jgi:hypothetical protein